MISPLQENPILLLFIVASLGYLLGTIKIKGSSLGVAAVLFTGLAFGAMDSSLEIPAIIFNLGLILFVYSIGLSSGPAFFKSYKKNGLRDFGFLIFTLLFSGFVAAVLFLLFDLSAAVITGAYAGSTTNTPALAGVIDYINNNFGGDSDAMIKDAVIGYSFSYPMGVLGAIISIIIMEKVLKIDYEAEKKSLRKEYPVDSNLSSATVRITNNEIFGKDLRSVLKLFDFELVFGRIFKGKEVELTNWSTVLDKDDILMIIGAEDDLKEAIQKLGELSKNELHYDRSKFDVKRIFVSKQEFVGKSLVSLGIGKKFNAIITRIRRGDVEMLASEDTVLELGDRIRFVAERKDLRALAAYFGDSYAKSSTVNLFSYGLGIGLGLLIGSFTISFGENFNFKLGYAGGPLIVGLILGALRRTGPIVWTLPYSSTITLKQLGLILLLAGIGVNSGHALVESFNNTGLTVFLISIIISVLTALTLLFIGYKIVKLPFSLLIGIVANQPAILDFASSRTGNNIPQFGYAMMFPIALIMKIVIAQLLFMFLV